jgi:threonine dehydrogenase-like Zn-dependent dehydrogenase
MKAVVYHGIGDIRLDRVSDPALQAPSDAILRITASAICGTDLHFVRGTMPDMQPGTIMGHEAVGIVEEVGKDVRNFRRGDRVVVPSTIACGYCSYCRSGYQAQCDNSNPHGPQAGTAFFGGPKSTGPFDGLQAEYARIPYAAANLVKLPDDIDDDSAVMLSDIFPTGYFGAEMAEITAGDTVVVYGCGPVGLFAIASARLKGADRIIAVDCVPDRLEMARAQGAEVIDFTQDDPVEVINGLTGGIGPDRAIDAVGIDAIKPPTIGNNSGWPEQRQWVPGDGPSQVLQWCVESVAKAGTVDIIGVYPDDAKDFPIGMAMNKNLTIKMGNCNHRRYLPGLVDLVRSGAIEPTDILTKIAPLSSVIEAYKNFDRREAGWVKVKLEPETVPA